MKMFIDLDFSMLNYAPLQKYMMSMKKRDVGIKNYLQHNNCMESKAFNSGF